jgi:hypothetical protein
VVQSLLTVNEQPRATSDNASEATSPHCNKAQRPPNLAGLGGLDS